MINPEDGLSTGSTLLNLHVTGSPHVGFLKGLYFFIVGDSDSGKTFQCVTCLAEATINPEFDNYRLIYDNIEDGMKLDIEKLFNAKLAERMEPPAGTKDAPEFSHTVESFYYNLDNALLRAGWDSKKRQRVESKGGNRPFIYVLDSQDALDSEAADKKFHDNKAAWMKKQGRGDEGGDDGKEEKIAGSYGDGKAKKHSEFLRKACKGIRMTNSILIIVSQTRDNITGGGKTRSGGRALKFWAKVEWWSRVVKRLTKTVNDIERKVGTKVGIEFKKNHVTGILGDLEIDIYPTHGFDDVGACVDYLVREGKWKRGKTTIEATHLGITATREKIVKTIEQRGWEMNLRELVGETWQEVQQACVVKRKNKYAEA